MIQRKKKTIKKKILTIILLFNIIVPLILLNVKTVSAFWLKEPDQFSYSFFDDIEPNMAFDENGTMHYVYTVVYAQANSYEIAYYNNSEGDLFSPNFVFLSEGLSPNSSNNHYPDIAIDLEYNSTIHCVWQGDTGADTDIYYSNNSGSFLWEDILTFDSGIGDDIYPSIVAIDSYVFITYRSVTDDEIKLITNYDSNTLGGVPIDIGSPAGSTPGRSPCLLESASPSTAPLPETARCYLRSRG